MFDISRTEIMNRDISIYQTSIYKWMKFDYAYAKSIYRDSFLWKNITSNNFSIGSEKLLDIYSSLKRGLDSLLAYLI